MQPYWDNGIVRLYHADARSIPLPDESVHCVCTSPPYWGLRDYGLEPSVWGGDADCPHYWTEGIASPGSRAVDSKESSTLDGPPNQMRDAMPQSAFCRECGAWRGTLGLEPTLDLYVEHIVEIFREVRRVLRKDGTCWVNLGDSYAHAATGNHAMVRKMTNVSASWTTHESPTANTLVDGLKPKDLCGIPWRAAFALQADGWWLRSDIVWAKPNPMPESVSDRPTRAHEYVFLLTKSGTHTYWTHRDGLGSRVAPAPDYRWIDHVAGVEYETEPAGWSDELIGCPDCEGEGEITITVGQATLFDGPPILVKVCSRCSRDGAETPGRIRRWKRVNLWRGHDYFYDADAIREPMADSSIASDLARYVLDSRPAAIQDYGSDSNRSARRSLENLARRTPMRVGTSTTTSQTLKGRYATANGQAARPRPPARRVQRPLGRHEQGRATGRWAQTSATVWQHRHAAVQNGNTSPHSPRPSGRPPILAGTSKRGVCAECGAPWARVAGYAISKPRDDVSEAVGESRGDERPEGSGQEQHMGWPITRGVAPCNQSLGWQPTCACNDSPSGPRHRARPVQRQQAPPASWRNAWDAGPLGWTCLPSTCNWPSSASGPSPCPWRWTYPHRPLRHARARLTTCWGQHDRPGRHTHLRRAGLRQPAAGVSPRPSSLSEKLFYP